MKKLTIDRNIWLRGEGHAKSKLYRSSDGKQCCVGVYLIECGIDKEKICDTGEVGNSILNEEVNWIRTQRSGDVGQLYLVNDYVIGEEIMSPIEIEINSEVDREKIITEVFKKHNIEVEFVN